MGSFFYYGSSINCLKRRATHLRSLKQGNHRNRFMQRAYNKLNEFNFTVIEFAVEEDLIKIEQEYIESQFEEKNCMNLSRDAMSFSRTQKGKATLIKNNKSRIWTPEQRSKISKANKGRNFTMPQRVKDRRKGHLNANAKLTEQDIEDIVEKRKAGAMVIDLAKEYKVARSTIQRTLKKFSVPTIYPKTWTKKMRESQAKNKNPRGKQFKKGELPYNTKLNEQDVSYIYKQIKTGAEMVGLAKKYQVNPRTIYEIKAGRNWNSVTEKIDAALLAEWGRRKNL